MPEMSRQIVIVSRPKSIAIAYILLTLFGLFGGHRFYLGLYNSGLLLLLLTLLCLGLFLLLKSMFPLALPGLWLIVDACLIPLLTQQANAKAVGEMARKNS